MKTRFQQKYEEPRDQRNGLYSLAIEILRQVKISLQSSADQTKPGSKGYDLDGRSETIGQRLIDIGPVIENPKSDP
jgi:hypothetical protein